MTCVGYLKLFHETLLWEDLKLCKSCSFYYIVTLFLIGLWKLFIYSEKYFFGYRYSKYLLLVFVSLLTLLIGFFNEQKFSIWSIHKYVCYICWSSWGIGFIDIIIIILINIYILLLLLSCHNNFSLLGFKHIFSTSIIKQTCL